MANSVLASLVRSLEERTATIGIAGLGYVGLPLALTYCEKGYKVVGIDVDEEKISDLNAGKSYIQHIESERIGEAVKKGLLRGTVDFSEANGVDAIILCVPTPLNEYREPDLSYILNTVNSLAPYLKRGQLLSLESTTYPGTTDEVLRPIVEKRGLTVGNDFFLVYSPEREDPGNERYNTGNIPKVLGGSTRDCQEAGVALYNGVICDVVTVSSTRAAEMTKLLENIHRAVNIGLMNELKVLTDRMGIDLYEVVRAAATKPFGFVPYYPGPGLGGHCIPIDPFYLTWKAREYGMHTRFIELAGEINTNMPEYVISKTADALNERNKSVKGSRILILGLAYKKNVDDMRESPSVELMEILRKKGAVLSFCDPFFKEFPVMRKHSFDLQSIELTSDNIRSFDALILATDHDCFDYKLIAEEAKLIIDTRGRYVPAGNIIRA